MKLTGPFTVDALNYRTGCSRLRGLHIPFPSERSVRLSERKSEAISQLTEHTASWKPTQILEWSKKDIIFSRLTSSFQLPSREMKEETCDCTLTSIAHSNMWIMKQTENTDHHRAVGSTSVFRPGNVTHNASRELNVFWLSWSVPFRKTFT